jgi:hypothetical protein
MKRRRISPAEPIVKPPHGKSSRVVRLGKQLGRRLPRADVRWFFGLSMFTYACYDLAFRPFLVFLISLLERRP